MTKILLYAILAIILFASGLWPFAVIYLCWRHTRGKPVQRRRSRHRTIIVV